MARILATIVLIRHCNRLPLISPVASSELTASTNPFERGCLFTKGLTSQLRVCNSEDSLPDALDQGICREHDIDYMEIRIHSDNWESILFEAWILQILLSELLGIPSTVEPGTANGALNFYHADALIEFGKPGSDEALKRAFDIGDCRHANRNAQSYQSCTHIDPERWTSTYLVCCEMSPMNSYHVKVLTRARLCTSICRHTVRFTIARFTS